MRLTRVLLWIFIATPIWGSSLVSFLVPSVALANSGAPAYRSLIRVGFIDTGLNYELPRFEKYLEANVGMEASTGGNDITDVWDHGTGVVDRFLSFFEKFSLILSRPLEIKIRMAKLDDSTFVTQAIEYLISEGVSIINMSQSFFMDDSGSHHDFRQVVRLNASKVLFIISAGKDGKIKSLSDLKLHSTDLNFTNVLIVGGVTNIPVSNRNVISTNYGPAVDVVGFNGKFQVLGVEGEMKKIEVRGISYVIPEVTALAAIAQAHLQKVSPNKIIKLIRKCSQTFTPDGKPSKKVILFKADEVARCIESKQP